MQQRSAGLRYRFISPELSRVSVCGLCLATVGQRIRQLSAQQQCMIICNICFSVVVVLAAKDPEWFEKIDKLTPADLVAVAKEFAAQTVDKVQHGEWCGSSTE